jgi:hypothetical protein
MRTLAQIGGLGNTIMGFATVGLTAVIFMLILGKFDNITDTGGDFANTDANSAVDSTMEAGSTIAGMLPILALVIIAGYVLASIGVFGGNR